MSQEERTGEAFELGEQLTVIGHKLASGDAAPDFALERFDAEAGALQEVHLADSAGAVRLLNVVNSLDTPVCHVETRQWEHLRGDLPAGVTVYTISMDLPFAQARWSTAEGVAHQALSAHKSEAWSRLWRAAQRVAAAATRRLCHQPRRPHRLRRIRPRPDARAGLRRCAGRRAPGSGAVARLLLIHARC